MVRWHLTVYLLFNLLGEGTRDQCLKHTLGYYSMAVNPMFTYKGYCNSIEITKEDGNTRAKREHGDHTTTLFQTYLCTESGDWPYMGAGEGKGILHSPLFPKIAPLKWVEIEYQRYTSAKSKPNAYEVHFNILTPPPPVRHNVYSSPLPLLVSNTMTMARDDRVHIHVLFIS